MILPPRPIPIGKRDASSTINQIKHRGDMIQFTINILIVSSCPRNRSTGVLRALAVLRWALTLTSESEVDCGRRTVFIARVRYRFLVFVSTCYCYLQRIPLPCAIPIFCTNSKVPAGQPYPEPLWGGRLQFLNAACRVSIHNADDNESILSFHYFSTFFFVLVLHLSLSWFCSCLELLSMVCHVAVVAKELEQTMWVTRKGFNMVLTDVSLFIPCGRARCSVSARCLGELGASHRARCSISARCLVFDLMCLWTMRSTWQSNFISTSNQASKRYLDETKPKSAA